MQPMQPWPQNNVIPTSLDEDAIQEELMRRRMLNPMGMPQRPRPGLALPDPMGSPPGDQGAAPLDAALFDESLGVPVPQTWNGSERPDRPATPSMTADPTQRVDALPSSPIDAARSTPRELAMIAQTSRARQNDEARAAAAARQASLMKRFPNQRLPDPMTLEPGQGLADAREAADVALLAGAPTGQKTDALWALGGRARNLKRPDPAKPRMSALEDTENPLNGRWISSGKELTRLEWAKERAKLRSQARANLLTKDERDAIDSPGLTGKDRPLYTGGMSKEQAARLAEKQSEMKDRIAERRKADVAKNAAAMAASSNPQRARTGMMLLDQLQAGPANAGGMDIVRNAMAVARQAMMGGATPAQAMAVFTATVQTGQAQANADRAAAEKAADRKHDLTIEEQRGKNMKGAYGARNPLESLTPTERAQASFIRLYGQAPEDPAALIRWQRALDTHIKAALREEVARNMPPDLPSDRGLPLGAPGVVEPTGDPALLPPGESIAAPPLPGVIDAVGSAVGHGASDAASGLRGYFPRNPRDGAAMATSVGALNPLLALPAALWAYGTKPPAAPSPADGEAAARDFKALLDRANARYRSGSGF